MWRLPTLQVCAGQGAISHGFGSRRYRPLPTTTTLRTLCPSHLDRVCVGGAWVHFCAGCRVALLFPAAKTTTTTILLLLPTTIRGIVRTNERTYGRTNGRTNKQACDSPRCASVSRCWWLLPARRVRVLWLGPLHHDAYSVALPVRIWVPGPQPPRWPSYRRTPVKQVWVRVRVRVRAHLPPPSPELCLRVVVVEAARIRIPVRRRTTVLPTATPTITKMTMIRTTRIFRTSLTNGGTLRRMR